MGQIHHLHQGAGGGAYGKAVNQTLAPSTNNNVTIAGLS